MGSSPLTQYAAGLCKATIDGYSDWYLPAICEMGPDSVGAGNGCGTIGSPTLQNIESNLVANGNIGGFTAMATLRHTSTEWSTSPTNQMWFQLFDVTPASAGQGTISKSTTLTARCVRAITL